MKSSSFRLITVIPLIMLLMWSCSTRDENMKGKSSKIGGQMILATTTSTYDSGLLDVLIPTFEEATGVNVKIISVGSGQALSMAETGEADALLVHAQDEEEILEEKGAVINRHRVMHNDFVLLGPKDDPAEIKSLSIEDGFTSIQNHDAPYFSRGDDSGTHFKELSIWDKVNIKLPFESYQETGSGMGDTLRVAAEKQGYVLTDRSTYLSLEDGLDSLTIIIDGDESLENIYHVMQVNPNLSEHINVEAAEAFITFFINTDTQKTIKEFGKDEFGQPLFFPHLIE
jgi:tungstate transport system substrate-binding protein